MTQWLSDRGLNPSSPTSDVTANELIMELGLDDYMGTTNKCDLATYPYSSAVKGWNNGKFNCYLGFSYLYRKHFLEETNLLPYGIVKILYHLQQPMQSVPITTDFVSSNLDQGEVYPIQHYVIKFVSDLRQVGGFLHQ